MTKKSTPVTNDLSESKPKESEQKQLSITKIMELGPALIGILDKSGLTIEQIQAASDEDLLKIDGILPTRLAKIRKVFEDV